jgi:fused signal recognition particle receptor
MTERWHALGLGDPSAMAAIIAGVVLLAVILALLIWRRRRSGGSALMATAGARPATVAAGLAGGLTKTRASMLARILPLLGRERMDPGAIEEIEAALLSGDVGVRMTSRLLESLQRRGDGQSPRLRLEREIREILASGNPCPEAPTTARPHVVMVVGVNGVGKTTFIGKLAARYAQGGKQTLLVAADTFRAAAIEQLSVWAERTGADLVKHQHGADPGAVAYDGIRAALARDVDVVIVDTAGRLHTKSNLMDELRKVRRVIGREVEGAPHETLLVIDAVTGQNGLAQARAFLEHLAVTGVVLTKLDGTAKGGIVLAIAGELQIPIRYVGVGEGIEDLREFDPSEFVAALLTPVETSGLP